MVEKQGTNKKKNNGGEKKTKESEEQVECGEGDGVSMILKIDLHCEGCAQKVERSVKLMEGVESVKTDFSSNNLTGEEKVDPKKSKSLEEKTKKKVELVSSSQPTKKNNGGGGGGGGNDKSGKKDHNDKKGGKTDQDEKPKEVISNKVVTMKTIVHCLGCAQKIKKIIRKYKGVEEVNVELEKNQITVKGTIDTKILIPYLNTKLKRPVEEITATVSTKKKDDGSEEKKQQKDGSNKKSQGSDQEKAGTTNTNGTEKKGGVNNTKKEKDSGFSENKQLQGNEGGSEKKKNDNSEKKKGGGGGGDINKKKQGEKDAATDIGGTDSSSSSFGFPMNGEKTTLHINKMEFFASYPYGYTPQPLQLYNANQTDGSEYRWQTPDYLHAPQMFSDENPNACSLM